MSIFRSELLLVVPSKYLIIESDTQENWSIGVYKWITYIYSRGYVEQLYCEHEYL